MRPAILVCVLLAVAWIAPLEATLAWGWDETMHVAQPAWRMLGALEQGQFGRFFEALHACDRYPFVYPLVLALEQGAFGISEHGARVLGTLLWCATILVIFAAARRAEPERAQAAWWSLAAAATSPLALGFAATTMLETPSAFAIALALASWLRRRDEPLASPRRAGRDRWAGLCLALAFFTKFNYGLLLGAALALDEAFELALARERRQFRVAFASSARLALVPALALAWWFLAPLPAGFDVAAEHRSAFLDWLRGNQDQAAAPWRLKLLNAAAFFAPNPRVLALLAIGVLATAPLLGRPAIRASWLVLLVLAFGVLAHPFHLARFLIPIGPALWLLAGVGWSRILPRERLLRWPLGAALVIACVVAPGADTRIVAERLGFLSDNPEVRAYQERELAAQRNLLGSRRNRSLGLAVEESQRFFDLIAPAVGSAERVAWIDLCEEVSPAGLQYGLLRRGREREAFAEQLWDTNYVSIGGVDPQWSDERLLDWAGAYDVLLFSEPHHLRGRRGREFFGDYVARLEQHGWRRLGLGALAVERPLQSPLEVQLFALRRER